MTTVAQIRKIVKANYSKHFAVTKLKYQNCETNWAVQNGFGDDFTSVYNALISAGIKAEMCGNKNSIKVYQLS